MYKSTRQRHKSSSIQPVKRHTSPINPINSSRSLLHLSSIQSSNALHASTSSLKSIQLKSSHPLSSSIQSFQPSGSTTKRRLSGYIHHQPQQSSHHSSLPSISTRSMSYLSRITSTNTPNTTTSTTSSLFPSLSTNHHKSQHKQPSSLSYSSTSRYKSLPIHSQSHRFMSEKQQHEEVGVQPPTEQEDTIFGKMTRGEIKVPTVYEDDKCIVIDDINPQAPIHMLVIPRKPIQQLSKSDDSDTELLGHLLTTARKVAKQREMDDGFRTVINDGVNGAQSVYHLHVHVLGGKKLSGRFD